MGSVALQSKDHRDLLDIIDKLRSRGISRYVDLPELIVCGDQSAGKSSVLEAISGMSFPTKDNLCTRFPTELVLRRDAAVAAKVSIHPGPDRSDEERERLLRYSPEVDITGDGLGQVIEGAKEVMGLGDSKVFSTDTLSIELCGPTQPHLTLVDLPGLFRAGNKDQSVVDAATVRDMVTAYVKRPRSIILAVVSAKSDFALQEVTELARRLDPHGTRTLGLITKPDTLDVGSDSERAYLRIAQNHDVVFRLGWHVLKNRSYEMREATSAERDAAEEEFFSGVVWASLNPTHCGVGHLKPRLSNVLRDQILHQLPGLLQDVEVGISDCRDRLHRLGDTRTTVDQQRRYLSRAIQDFSSLMRSALDGVYNDAFFGSARTPEGYQKRLRAVVQNTLAEFEETMRNRGQSRVICENQAHEGATVPGTVCRSDYIDEVKDLMKRSRGCELPGTFNPLIIRELFAEQCRPWRGITSKLEEDVLRAVYRTTRSMVDYVAVNATADGIFQIIVADIEKLKSKVTEKVTELLEPHYNGHPITYNHYLTETVQKAQARRTKIAMEKEIQHFLPLRNNSVRLSPDPTQLLEALLKHTEADMERYASSLAADYADAYYKVRR